MRTIALIGLVAAMVGCDAVSSYLAKNPAIESILAVQVAGEYTVTIEKGGTTLLVEKWKCDVGPDGKLSGCHKQAGTPAP